MLKLKLNNTASAWVDVVGGVKVLLPPCSTPILRAAEFIAHRAVAAAREAMGLEDGDALTEEQTAKLEGVFAEARIRSIASNFEKWEGLAGEDDQEIEISPEALDAFAAHPALGRTFMAAYEAGSIQLVQEGKNSEPSGAGKRRGAKRTAEAAPVAAQPVPAS